MAELTEDDIFDNDIDPLDGLAAIRREEGNEEAAEELSREVITAEADVPDVLPEVVAPSDVLPEVVAPSDVLPEVVVTESESKIVADGEADKVALEKDVPDDKANTPAKRKFKANGQDFEFSEAEILEQFEGVFGKAMDYTQKTQKMAPYRKMISALEEESITQDQFDLAMDVLKGDKAAIKKLAADREIDLSDLSFDDEVAPYTPSDYGKSDLQIEISDIEKSISSDVEYPRTVEVIDNQWDDGSRRAIADNPSIIRGLHHDIRSGVYDKVAPEAAKLQMLGGNSKSSLDYYLLAGADYQKKLESGRNQTAVDDLNKGTQEAETKFEKESSEADIKRAASPTSAAAGKKGVVNYLEDDDNDEKFNAWYAKTTNAQ